VSTGGSKSRGIDVPINNAGTIIVGLQYEMSVDDYEQAMAVNFCAAVHTRRNWLP